MTQEVRANGREKTTSEVRYKSGVYRDRMGEAGEIGNKSVLLKVHSFPEVQLLVARWLVVDQTVEAASGREVWTVMSARKTAELTHIHRQRAGSDQAEHAAAVRCGAVSHKSNESPAPEPVLFLCLCPAGKSAKARVSARGRMPRFWLRITMTKAPNQQTPARDKTVEASKMLWWLIPHWAPGSQWGLGI